LPDSTKIANNDIKAALEAFTELNGCDSIQYLQEQEIASKGLEIDYWKDGLEDCSRINDTLTQKVIPLIQEKDSIHNSLYLGFRKAFYHEKTKAILSGLSIPIVAIISFLIGFTIHR